MLAILTILGHHECLSLLHLPATLVAQFAHVDFVEEGHHHEHIEQHGIVHTGSFFVVAKANLIPKTTDREIGRKAVGTTASHACEVIGGPIKEIKYDRDLVK